MDDTAPTGPRAAPPVAPPADDSHRHAPMRFRELVAMVAALMALNALAVDIMLPAIQDIGAALGVADPNDRQAILPAYLVGFGLGQLLAGSISDRFGRRPILFLAAVLYAVSAVGSAVAPSFWFLVVARMIGGLGVGASLIIAPMYIAEISPPKMRGQMVSFNQLNIVLGISVAFFTNYLILQLGQSDAAWAEALRFGEDRVALRGVEGLLRGVEQLVIFRVGEVAEIDAVRGREVHHRRARLGVFEGGVEPLLAADRQPHAMDRDREPLGEAGELRQRPPAVAHVVLGMDLQPGDGAGRGEDLVEMLRLVSHPGREGQAGAGGDVEHGGALLSGAGLGPRPGVGRGPAKAQAEGRSRSSGSSEPSRGVPSAIAGRSTSSQVPAGTSVQALPWKSTVEVPAQVVPGPAAQSFSPARLTP